MAGQLGIAISHISSIDPGDVGRSRFASTASLVMPEGVDVSEDAGLWVLPIPRLQKDTCSSGCARVNWSICKNYCRPTDS